MCKPKIFRRIVSACFLMSAHQEDQGNSLADSKLYLFFPYLNVLILILIKSLCFQVENFTVILQRQKLCLMSSSKYSIGNSYNTSSQDKSIRLLGFGSSLDKNSWYIQTLISNYNIILEECIIVDISWVARSHQSWR